MNRELVGVVGVVVVVGVVSFALTLSSCKKRRRRPRKAVEFVLKSEFDVDDVLPNNEVTSIHRFSVDGPISNVVTSPFSQLSGIIYSSAVSPVNVSISVSAEGRRHVE